MSPPSNLWNTFGTGFVGSKGGIGFGFTIFAFGTTGARGAGGAATGAGATSTGVSSACAASGAASAGAASDIIN